MFDIYVFSAISLSILIATVYVYMVDARTGKDQIEKIKSIKTDNDRD